MQMFQVTYTVYQGQSNQVLNEGTTVVPSTTGRMGAENAIKGMFNSNVNHVAIRSVFPVNK
jgi:hypothetical protein